MSRVIEDVLAAWRDGERLLEELPVVDPDHETIALSVAELRQLYARMTEALDVPEVGLGSAEAVVRSSRAAIERVRGRLGASSAADSLLSAGPTLDLEGDPG